MDIIGYSRWRFVGYSLKMILGIFFDINNFVNILYMKFYRDSFLESDVCRWLVEFIFRN